MKTPLFPKLASRTPARIAVCLLLAAALGTARASADELPLLGLAGVSLRVADMDAARHFYHDVGGFDETPAARGAAGAVYFKVNDDQLIELVPGLPASEVVPMTRILIRTSQLERLHAELVRRGLTPGEIGPERDGSRGFALTKLPGQRLEALEFVQYGPESVATQTKGQYLGARRLSTHLEHAGILATDFDAAYDFYVKGLGFGETWRRVTTDQTRVVIDHIRMPGPSGDFVELSNQAGSAAPLTRTRAGTAAHLALEVPDIKVVEQEAPVRQPRVRAAAPRYGLDNRWNFNLFDPDGTRMEFMQTEDPAHRAPAVVVTPADFQKKGKK